MTGEKTLPVLEAAHIKPYAVGGEHVLSNGLLLRSDLHTLFDRGYLGVDPVDRRVMVSSRIREQFENGKHYYALAGTPLATPADLCAIPDVGFLQYHADKVYR